MPDVEQEREAGRRRTSWTEALVLVADDVADTGLTLRSVQGRLP